MKPKQNMDLIKGGNIHFLNYRRKFIMPLTPMTMWGKYGDFLYLYNKGGNYKDDEEKELENFHLYGGKNIMNLKKIKIKMKF